MEVKPTRLGATLKFGAYGQPLGQPYHAQLDLFEHQYNDHFRFWWGVAEVACNQQDILTPVANSPGSFVVAVQLSDGRTGLARYVDMLADHTAPGSNITIALIGEKELRGMPGR
jgi:hypothetical protein